MSSRPLFIRVAESMVIFAPMCQLGVLEGVCTGLAAQLLGGHAEEGAAGEQNFSQAGALSLSCIEDGGVLSVHRQQLHPVLFHSLRDQMRASLLASARSWPLLRCGALLAP